MILTKAQLLSNLVKYNVLSANEARRLSLSKRESIVRLMNEHLPANIIKEIYEYEYCTDKDQKDYTPIKGFNPYSEKQANEERVEMVYNQEHKDSIAKEDKPIFDTKQEKILRGRPKKNKITVGDLLFKDKRVSAYKKQEMLKDAISDDKVQKVLDKIEENY